MKFFQCTFMFISLFSCLSGLEADWTPNESIDEKSLEWIQEQNNKELLPLDKKWVEEVVQRANFDAVEQFRQELKKQLLEKEGITYEPRPIKGSTPCFHGKNENDLDEKNLIFMSFSVPEQTWIELSKEAHEHGAVFVLRGLPDNSFRELSKRILKLTNKGVEIPIKIDPTLFKKYQVERVPTFVSRKGKSYDKVSGHVSFQYVTELFGISITDN